MQKTFEFNKEELLITIQFLEFTKNLLEEDVIKIANLISQTNDLLKINNLLQIANEEMRRRDIICELIEKLKN